VTCLRVHDTPLKPFEKSENESLNTPLSQFWNCGSLRFLSPVDDIYATFKTNLTFDGVRYLTKLPTKPNIAELSNNRLVAEQRLTETQVGCQPEKEFHSSN